MLPHVRPGRSYQGTGFVPMCSSRLTWLGQRCCRLVGCTAQLGSAVQLEELSICGDCGDTFAPGLNALPRAWTALTSLTHLELRGHRLLLTLPPWLPQLGLKHLDISGCSHLDLALLPSLTTLHTLGMQARLCPLRHACSCMTVDTSPYAGLDNQPGLAGTVEACLILSCAQQLAGAVVCAAGPPAPQHLRLQSP